jgi:hypothetical protein
MPRHTYEIRVIGSLGPAAREAFGDMLVEVEPTITVLSGDLDQQGLHDLLDRVRALGLELVGVKQAPPQSGLSDSRLSSMSSRWSDRMRLSAPYRAAWSRSPTRTVVVPFGSMRKSANASRPISPRPPAMVIR